MLGAEPSIFQWTSGSENPKRAPPKQRVTLLTPVKKDNNAADETLNESNVSMDQETSEAEVLISESQTNDSFITTCTSVVEVNFFCLYIFLHLYIYIFFCPFFFSLIFLDIILQKFRIIR